MKTYIVVVQWSMASQYEVQARSIEEAHRIVSDLPGLPEESQYVDDSWFIHEDLTEEKDER